MIRENFLNHWITGKVLQHQVFDTFYYDAKKKRWTKNRPNVKVCDVKYDSYFMIDDERYDNLQEAKEAFLTNILMDILMKEGNNEN